VAVTPPESPCRLDISIIIGTTVSKNRICLFGDGLHSGSAMTIITAGVIHCTDSGARLMCVEFSHVHTSCVVLVRRCL
jgi:hypothetical protein